MERLKFIVYTFRQQLIKLFAMSLLVALLDVLVLIVFAQFLSLMGNDDNELTFFWGRIVSSDSGDLYGFLPVLLLVYLTNAILTRRIQFLSTSIGYDLASNIHRKAMFDPEFVLRRTKADFMSHLYTEANRFSTNVVSQMVMLTNKLLMTIGVLVVLLYEAYEATLIAFISLFVTALIYSLITKPTLFKNGKILTELNSTRMQHLEESYDGIEYIVSYDMRGAHSLNYEKQNASFAYRHSLNQFLQQLPKYVVESIIVLGVLLLIILVNSGLVVFDQEQIYVLGIGAMKLLPNVNVILASLSKFRANVDSVDVMKSYSEEFSIQEESQVLDKLESLEYLIIENLSFRYPNGTEVFKGLTMHLKRGQWVLLNAPSGSGKTTLLRLILGIYAPTSGRIFYNNVHALRDRQALCSHYFGYVSQDVIIFSGSVLDNIILNRRFEKSELDLLIKNCKIDFLDMPCRSLSGGQKQRLGIARALLMHPDVLVLDEAFTGIDKKSSRDIRKFIEERFVTSLIIEVNHIESEVNYSELVSL